MKQFAAATLLILVLAGCGGATKTDTSTTASSSADSTATSSATASGCTASGLDAMTALSSFEMDMGKAQKDGKITVDQLTAARDKLFNQTQAAADKNDPFALARAMTHIRVGICTPNQAGEDAIYNAEPYTVQRPHPVTGEPFAATEYKNRVRP